MPRRQPATSVKAMIGAMQNASMPPLDPPAHCKLRDGDRPFWDGIVRARARDDWTECDLVVAAQLARTQYDIETEQVALQDEGTTLLNARGTQVMNPRVTVLEGLARREMALMRALRLAGTPAGTPRDEANARKVERQARKVHEEISDDEDNLLAV